MGRHVLRQRSQYLTCLSLLRDGAVGVDIPIIAGVFIDADEVLGGGCAG